MLSNLTNIPRVMRGRGWLNGARLLDTWFSRARAVAPGYSAPDTTTIKMAWVLRFPRAKAVYDQLIRERIWANAPAQARIAAVLRKQGLLGGGGVSFGPNFSSNITVLDGNYINFRAVPESVTFDDMTAALGAFAFRVLVAGSVAPRASGGGFDVELSEVGVYIRDSFDFEGDQYLGCWSDNPDGFSALMPPDPAMSMGMGFAFREPLFSPVGNRNFREWRQKTGRGGDFLVFSDIDRVPLNPPDRFVVR